jgi:hypothetical protein
MMNWKGQEYRISTFRSKFNVVFFRVKERSAVVNVKKCSLHTLTLKYWSKQDFSEVAVLIDQVSSLLVPVEKAKPSGLRA